MTEPALVNTVSYLRVSAVILITASALLMKVSFLQAEISISSNKVKTIWIFIRFKNRNYGVNVKREIQNLLSGLTNLPVDIIIESFSFQCTCYIRPGFFISYFLLLSFFSLTRLADFFLILISSSLPVHSSSINKRRCKVPPGLTSHCQNLIMLSRMPPLLLRLL